MTSSPSRCSRISLRWTRSRHDRKLPVLRSCNASVEGASSSCPIRYFDTQVQRCGYVEQCNRAAWISPQWRGAISAVVDGAWQAPFSGERAPACPRTLERDPACEHIFARDVPRWRRAAPRRVCIHDARDGLSCAADLQANRQDPLLFRQFERIRDSNADEDITRRIASASARQ